MDGYTASQRGLLLMGPATEGQGKDSPAYRLAKLEDGIRALADKYHNADAEQPGAVVRADTFEVELRALLHD